MVSLIKGNTALQKTNHICKPLFAWLVKKLFLKGSFRRLKQINPDQYNGASLVGFDRGGGEKSRVVLGIRILFTYLTVLLYKFVNKFGKILAGLEKY